MNKEKVKQFIENIEQLGADARFSFDTDNDNELKIHIDSIIYWCNRVKRELKKEDRSKENEL